VPHTLVAADQKWRNYAPLTGPKISNCLESRTSLFDAPKAPEERYYTESNIPVSKMHLCDTKRMHCVPLRTAARFAQEALPNIRVTRACELTYLERIDSEKKESGPQIFFVETDNKDISWMIKVTTLKEINDL
jgi:hypothetical protein